MTALTRLLPPVLITILFALLVFNLGCTTKSADQEPSTLGQAIQTVAEERGLSPAPTPEMAEQTGLVNEWQAYEHDLTGKVVQLPAFTGDGLPRMLVMCTSYSESVKTSRTRNYETFSALGVVIQWDFDVVTYPGSDVDIGIAWDAKGDGPLTLDMVEDDGTDHILNPDWLMQTWETGTKRDTLMSVTSSHAEKFLDKLGQSEVLLIVVQEAGTGTASFAAFDTRGYEQAIAPIAETCN